MEPAGANEKAPLESDPGEIDGAAGRPVTAFLVLTFGALLALHFFEPDLRLTWSYAHLSRTPALPWIAATLVVALPVLARVLLALPAAAQGLSQLPIRAAVGGAAGILILLLALGHAFPAPSTSLDAGLFLGWVTHGGDVARWHLLLKSYQLVVQLFDGIAEPVVVVRSINATLATIALVATVACARMLSRTRGEAVVLALLQVSAMGVLQLCIGYADVYPLPLAVTAVYVACGLGVIRERLHPFWPLLLVAVGPFFYVGLVLLAPSLLVVVACTLRQQDGLRRLAVGGAVATVLGGAATLPRFGALFAWGAYLDAIDELPATHMGSNPEGYSLPLERVLTTGRLEEVFHLLLLVDPVGWVLILGTAAYAAWRWRAEERVTLAFLALLVLPYAVFLFTMEPLYGAYGDWDLFSYGAVASGLLGGYAFLLSGRAFPRHFPLLAGLALACASVHLLARMHALDVDAERHLRESPSIVEDTRPTRPPD